MRIEILVYTLTWILCYAIIQNSYARYRRQSVAYDVDDYTDTAKRKINYISICGIALLWVAFNAFITTTHPITGGDRMNIYDISSCAEELNIFYLNNSIGVIR